MPKTRLTDYKRITILSWMVQSFVERIDLTEEHATRDALIERCNVAIRAKYPEADMIVLRKYDMTRFDSCLRLMEDDRPVFGAVLLSVDLADMPSHRGCHASDVFVVSPGTEAIRDRWVMLTKQREDSTTRKRMEYRSFLHSCKTVEDVESVVQLPAAVLSALRPANALVALNPATIATIRDDFAAVAENPQDVEACDELADAAD